MKKLFTLALSEDRDQLLALDPETGEVLQAQTIYPDVDGEDAAIMSAMRELIYRVDIDF